MKKITSFFKPSSDRLTTTAPSTSKADAETQEVINPSGGELQTSTSTSCTPINTTPDISKREHEPEPDGKSSSSSTPESTTTKRVRLEPKQPTLYHGSQHFPITKNRKFLPKWYEAFPWIEYHDEKDVVFCHPCTQVKQQGCSQLPKSQDEFTDKGFSNWKKAIDCFKKHENSSAHRHASYQFQSMKQGTNVASQLHSHQEQEMQSATRCLMKIISSIRYLARQGLPLRGHDDSESNLYQLLRLRAEDSQELADWLKRKTSWHSVEIQHEIVQEMAHNILRNVIREIKEQGAFGIMADETTDVSTTEQMSVCIRTVNDDLDVEEKFIGLYSMEKCDSASIYAAIMDVLTRCDLSVNNCRSQTFDGAATFQGSANGVAVQIARREPRAIQIHCYMHCVNLAVQDVVSTVPMIRDFLQLIQELTNFFRTSAKRTAMIKSVAEALECSQTNIRPLCPTRFTVKFRALDGVMKQLNVLPEVLKNIETSADNKVAAQTSGFRRRMTSFDFYFSLIVAHRLFEVTDRLSKGLQHESVSVGEGMEMVGLAVKEIKALRSDDRFAGIFNEAEQLATKCSADGPRLPRQSRAPRRLQESDSHRFETPRDFYRQQVYMALDVAVNKLNDRIVDKASPIIQSIERLIMSGINGVDIPQTDLERVTTFYGDDLDKSRLNAQLLTLENVREEAQVKSVHEVIGCLKGNTLKRMVPQVVKLLKLFLVCPSTTATAERSFSQLRRVKSYLRSTMSQGRLNHYMILASYPEGVDELDLRGIANSFISKNQLRRKVFKPL